MFSVLYEKYRAHAIRTLSYLLTKQKLLQILGITWQRYHLYVENPMFYESTCSTI